METLRPIPAVLISIEPGANGQFRSRLRPGQGMAGATESAVRVTDITPNFSVVVGIGEPPSEAAQVWLKLPGREPLKVLAFAKSEGYLTCQFLQPLLDAEFAAIVGSPSAQGAGGPRVHPRCTLLGLSDG